MKQNIYDDPAFFAGYTALRETDAGVNAALEEPALRSVLPPLADKHILDIGCGFGAFAAYCLEVDVPSYRGIDISARMLTRARHDIGDSRAIFEQTAAEDLELADNAYDLIVSSLCLHYVRDIQAVFANLASALRPGGRLALSVEHPICTARLQSGLESDTSDHTHGPADRYQDEGIRYANWFVDGVIKYHRTVASYVDLGQDCGLTLQRLLEPSPTETELAAYPKLAEHPRCPPILVLAFDQPRSTTTHPTSGRCFS